MAGAVLFDLDGTLVDSAPSLTRGLNEYVQRMGGEPLSAATVRPWISQGGETMLRGALGDRLTDPEKALEDFREILRVQTANPADLYPGTLEMLKALKGSGHQIAICTNKRENIAVPLADGLGIAPYIDFIVGGAAGRVLKPNPWMVDRALTALGAERAVFVGDSEVDAETAVAAKLPFVLVSFGYPAGDLLSIKCSAKIDAFSALPAIIDTLLK